jgi:Uma2 family endonuclease
MPDLRKAELIEGVVYVASPLRVKGHGVPDIAISTWLGTYMSATPGALASSNSTTRLDPRNVFQPNAWLMIDSGQAGRARLTPDDYLQGAPELVIEVASSSLAYDMGKKQEVYRRHGAPEYIVWQVPRRRVVWLELHNGAYVPIEPDGDSITRSRVFPGLWLDRRALVNGDMARVLAVLQEGLRSPEHASFVARLAATS